MKDGSKRVSWRVLLRSPHFFIAVILLALTVALCCAYALCRPEKHDVERTLEFNYDESRGGYIVSGVLPGSDGYRVEIPESYEGKPVVGVSCAIFASSTVREYSFAGDVEICDAHMLAGVDASGIKIIAGREYVDCIRARLYSCTDDEALTDIACSLANSTEVRGLAESERFINFLYDYNAYRACGGAIIPVYIGESGESLNIRDYAVQTGGFVHSDKTNVTLLDWAYTHANGYILSDIEYENSSVSGAFTLTENTALTVTCERVYRIYVQDGNDAKYDLRSAQPSFCYDVIDGENAAFRYVAESTADDFLDGVEQRLGFDLGWNYSARTENGQGEIHALTSIASALAEEGCDLNIFSVWTLKNAQVAITPSYSGGGITYGDDVTFSAFVTPPFGGMSVDYEWRHNGEIVGTQSALDLVCPSLVGAYDGVYTLKVTVYAPEITSFKTGAEAQINLKIEKRAVSIVWSGADNLTYDGGEHRVAATVANGVSGDDLGVNVEDAVAIDAGNYTATATLTGKDCGNYVLEDGSSFNFTVRKADLNLAVALADVVYGETPTPSLTGNAGGGKVDYLYGASIDSATAYAKLTVGKYYVVANVSETANYNAAFAFSAFNVTQREVELFWANCEKSVYNSAPRNVTATLGNTLFGDDVSVEVSGGVAVYAGPHVATAELIGDSANNYCLPQISTCTYVIEKCKVSIFADDKQSVYAEEEQELTATVEGIIYNREVSYYLRREEGKDAGIYAIEVVVEPNANYEITTHSATYTIFKQTPKIDGEEGGKIIIEEVVATGTLLDELTDSMPNATTDGTWLWKDGGNCSIDNAGKNTFGVTFVPSDSRNYNEVRLLVVAYVKKENNFIVVCGSPFEAEQMVNSDLPYKLIMWEEKVFFEFVLDEIDGLELHGAVKVTVIREDGTAAQAEVGEDIVTLMERGTYFITFECSGDDEYFSGSVTITVIVE